MTPRRIAILTVLAMIAFASNSFLCRLALRETAIDAASFTLIRVVSGAIMLWFLMTLRPSRTQGRGNWTSAFALFAYAAAFSFAYLRLSAGTGALLLFGAVQVTMIFWGMRTGERPYLRQWIGIALTFGGLLALLLPGLSKPPLGASLLMLSAGVAWGIYSLRGRGVSDPARATTGNFLRAVPFAVVLSLVFFPQEHLDRDGMIYAVLSGALASGFGYAIWYAALPGLKASTAATVQLSVPVLAATGGIVLLGEQLTLRFAFASVAVLGGIALVVLTKRRAI